MSSFNPSGPDDRRMLIIVDSYEHPMLILLDLKKVSHILSKTNIVAKTHLFAGRGWGNQNIMTFDWTFQKSRVVEWVQVL